MVYSEYTMQSCCLGRAGIVKADYDCPGHQDTRTPLTTDKTMSIFLARSAFIRPCPARERIHFHTIHINCCCFRFWEFDPSCSVCQRAVLLATNRSPSLPPLPDGVAIIHLICSLQPNVSYYSCFQDVYESSSVCPFLSNSACQLDTRLRLETRHWKP